MASKDECSNGGEEALGLGVSIVIVNWNTRDRVIRLLRGLVGTPESPRTSAVPPPLPIEVVVVDNNSSDGSVAAIRREFPEVKVLELTQNRGFAGGVNPGAAASTMPLLLLLNSDTETTADAVAATARYMEEHPEVGILGPQLLSVDLLPESSAWRDPSLGWMVLEALGLNKVKSLNFERYRDRVVQAPTEVDCVCGAVLMVRRDLFEQLGGLDEDYFMYFEETDLCVRARQRGHLVHHAPVGTFTHDKGGTSRAVRLRTFLDFRRSQILYHKKHGGWFHGLAARGLLVLGSAVRVPPLAVLAAIDTGRRTQALSRLRLNLHGLVWLLNPTGGLVRDVDRSR